MDMASSSEEVILAVEDEREGQEKDVGEVTKGSVFLLLVILIELYVGRHG